MKRTTLFRRCTWTLTIPALGMLFLLAPLPAEAQLWRSLGLSEIEGEPTDPDGALALLGEAGIDPEGSGLSATPPESEAEADAWWSAILDLLRQLLEGDSNR